MKIDIKYTRFHATDDIEEYARKRIESLTHYLKSFEKNNEITVFVEVARATKHHKSGDIFYAEATFDAGGKVFRAESTDVDIRLALDNVKEKLKKEIRHYKDKLVTGKRK
jgi:ribosomal subunit interface protein